MCEGLARVALRLASHHASHLHVGQVFADGSSEGHQPVPELSLGNGARTVNIVQLERSGELDAVLKPGRPVARLDRGIASSHHP